MSHCITVYLSSSTSVDRKYFDLARDLGAAIAKSNWTVVYGGNDVGPMGALANGARGEGGKVIGITPHCFNDGGVADKQCDELIFVDNMRERKKLLESRGSAFIALPGGIGTLEEFFEILVGRLLNFHTKPILVINIDGFWDPLLELLRRFEKEGFVRSHTFDHFEIVDSVEEAMQRLRALLANSNATSESPI